MFGNPNTPRRETVRQAINRAEARDIEVARGVEERIGLRESFQKIMARRRDYEEARKRNQ